VAFVATAGGVGLTESMATKGDGIAPAAQGQVEQSAKGERLVMAIASAGLPSSWSSRIESANREAMIRKLDSVEGWQSMWSAARVATFKR
jgi:hypothetical protein